MSTATFDFPQHAFRYEWQRDFRLLSRQHVTLAERYLHVSRHLNQEEVETRVSRAVDRGIRSIARAADRFDRKVLGWYRSTRFARRRSEYSDSAVYFAQD